MTPRALLGIAALAGCTAAAPLDARVPQLTGAWRIAAVDGKTALALREDTGKSRTPHFRFGARSYGGTSGCNSLGGLKIERGNRLYTYPGAQTAMACGGVLGRQEDLIGLVFRASPTLSTDGDDVILRGAEHSVRLVRDSRSPPPDDPPEAWQGTRLAGQRFEMHQIDGNSLNRRPAPLLSFSPRTVTLSHLCPRLVTGTYVQGRGTLRMDFGTGCAATRRLGGILSTVSGPNGELLIAGDGHWLAGDNLRRDRPK